MITNLFVRIPGIKTCDGDEYEHAIRYHADHPDVPLDEVRKKAAVTRLIAPNTKTATFEEQVARLERKLHDTPEHT